VAEANSGCDLISSVVAVLHFSFLVGFSSILRETYVMVSVFLPLLDTRHHRFLEQPFSRLHEFAFVMC